MHNIMTRAAALKLFIVSLIVVPGLSLAQTTSPYTSLVAAADWSAAKTDVVTVFAAVAGVIVVFTGALFLLRALRGK